MGITEAQRKAHEKYFSKAWKQVKLSMPVDEAEALETFCAEHEYSKAGFIRRAVRELMDRETSHTDDLDAAVRLVANATGETSDQLITRHIMQGLRGDVEMLACGLFEMAGGYKKENIEQINDVVSKVTGIRANEWMINQDGENTTEDSRQYVRDKQGAERRILWPGEVTAEGVYTDSQPAD